MSLFLDTSMIVAFYNQDDQNHSKAKDIMERVVQGEWGPASISDYVFDECVTVTLLKLSLKEAVALGSALIEGELSLLKATESIIQEAWDIFQKNPGKLSFTDCTNLAFIRLVDIDYLGTFDRGFRNVPGVNIVGL